MTVLNLNDLEVDNLHQYLGAVGFSNVKTKKELMELIKLVISEPSDKNFIETDRNSVICEYIKYFTTPDYSS